MIWVGGRCWLLIYVIGVPALTLIPRDTLPRYILQLRLPTFGLPFTPPRRCYVGLIVVIGCILLLPDPVIPTLYYTEPALLVGRCTLCCYGAGCTLRPDVTLPG